MDGSFVANGCPQWSHAENQNTFNRMINVNNCNALSKSECPPQNTFRTIVLDLTNKTS